jgi:hypothetical protein
MPSLATTGHEHHAALLPHVETLAELAAALDEEPTAELRQRLVAQHAFVTGQLLPHIERAEATLYPELERLMQNRHSMTPMRREHAELRSLIAELGTLVEGELSFAARLGLRRVLYRMYAILQVHLAEEEGYLGVLAGNLTPEEQDELGRAMAHAMAQPM